MNRPDQSGRASDITKALHRRFFLFSAVGIFSGVINLLALTGSLYMLQVYDRVIPSRSVATLVGLSLLMLGLYLVNGLLDMLRARVMTRIGLKFDKDIREQVFDKVLRLPLKMRIGGDRLQPVKDLDQIRAFLATPGPLALFDMPWMPLFILIIFALHMWLGMLALAGAIVLASLALVTEFLSRKPVRAAAQSAANRHVFADAARRNAEVIRAMGMGERIKAQWLEQSRHHLLDQRSASDVISGFGSMSKIIRMILQSAMLGLGAYLVIKGEATSGVMIAGSILLSRALAPVEIAIANWRGFVASRQSFKRLKDLFEALPAVETPMQLPAPCETFSVHNLWVAAPGTTQPIVQNVSFMLKAGAGVGIIGVSASGKSTLARAIVGVWQPMPQHGVVRLDGASLDQWSPDQLGRHIGYLPQDIELFDGTIAQNIARFDPAMTSAGIIAAARNAGMHDMILQLSQGYDTRIGEGGAILSAGQRQRIALTRALYGDPFLVVLDEPNSNLDAQGDAALAQAIKSVRVRGGIVIVVAHRPSVLVGLDQLIAMSKGQVKAFGPKDDVLKAVTARPASAGAKAAAGSRAVSQTTAAMPAANLVVPPVSTESEDVNPRPPARQAVKAVPPHRPQEFWTSSAPAPAAASVGACLGSAAHSTAHSAAHEGGGGGALHHGSVNEPPARQQRPRVSPPLRGENMEPVAAEKAFFRSGQWPADQGPADRD